MNLDSMCIIVSAAVFNKRFCLALLVCLPTELLKEITRVSSFTHPRVVLMLYYSLSFTGTQKEIFRKISDSLFKTNTRKQMRIYTIDLQERPLKCNKRSD